MAHLAGLGHALPDRVVPSSELAARLEVTEEWILGACGIRERRWLSEGESSASLAERAAQTALVRAHLTPSQLGAIIVGTGSAPRAFPGVSADLQRLLGAPGIPAFDVPLASVGGLFALALAVDLCPRVGPVLAAGAEEMSRVLLRAPLAKETAILFGDGAAACIVSQGDGPISVVDVRLGSDGTFANALSLGSAGPLEMDGRTVILQASRKLPAAIRSVLEPRGLSPADVDLFVLHQANLNLLRGVARSLGIGEEKLFVNVDRVGNTSAASVLVALSEASDNGLLRPGSRVVLAAFGAGFSWGAALLRVAG
ncbi:MAG TPA: ketoacyl-ACP synthase III [Thermoanaerobaculia bacterium]|nr:ketoacyl-ACP synthase III [Thermoanaerobaculia bacterium]